MLDSFCMYGYVLKAEIQVIRLSSEIFNMPRINYVLSAYMALEHSKK